jgi:quercetin dioxygenase-like cupin family protein
MTTFVPRLDQSFRDVAPGVQFCTLRAHGEDHGQTLLVRMQKGAHAQLHHHPGGEETFIVSGKLRIGEHCLVAGDYLWTPPGVSHEGHAEEETTFFVVLPEGLRV